MDIRTEQNVFREDLLHGKTAIVTGASRGIGAAIARRLCEAGANVVLCSRSAEAVAQIADTLQGKGYTAYAMAADISETGRAFESDTGWVFDRCRCLLCRAF